jgi:mannose-6-phosphate isomerase
MRPISLAPNEPRQFYRGGAALSAFRGTVAADERRPEDWIASTTARYGALDDTGLTKLADGSLLRDAILIDPEAWLGPEHAEAFGADPALLVKLLDAGERLPVHVHPDREFSRRHLDCPYGKTEAWVVLEAAGEHARVHLGFARDIEPTELAGWMAARDETAILAGLNAFEVAAGDAVLVPAGTPHAIGAGVFCLELQEPTDFSVVLELAGFPDIDPSQALLGLDADLARECVRSKALSARQLEHLRSAPRPVLEGVERFFPDEADPFFRAERIAPAGATVALDAAFSILVVISGEGRLTSGDGETLELTRGTATLIPHAAGETSVSGSLIAVRCRPPTVEAASADGLFATES